MDRFRLERQLGAGAFGEAHLATDRDGRRVVVKFIRAEFAKDGELRERFRREVRALELVKHPCIPALVSSGEHTDGRLYYAVEYCPGSDLNAAILAHPRPWPLARVLAVMEDLLAALGAAHRKGVVHRDVKPANVLLVGEGGRERARLIDFGIAKHFEAGDDTMQDLTMGRAIGTPHYLSPEQAEGEVVDARTDIYAAGIVAYELLAGARPFGGRTTQAVLRAILADPPPPLRAARPDAPEALERAIRTLLAKRREDRPATAEEAAQLLRGAMTPLATPPPPEDDGSAPTGILFTPPPVEPARRDPREGDVLADTLAPRGRPRRVSIAALLALLGGVAALAHPGVRGALLGHGAALPEVAPADSAATVERPGTPR